LTSSSKLEEILQLDSKRRPLVSQFVVADLEVQLLSGIIKGNHMRISTLMRSGQLIHHPFRIDAAVSLRNEIAEATALFVVGGHEDDVIELLMLGRVREVFVIVYLELLEGILHQTKRVGFRVTHTQIDRARALSLVQHSQSRIQTLRELKHVSDSISPRLAITCLVLFDWILFSHFFTNSSKLTKTSNRAYESREAQIDERM